MYRLSQRQAFKSVTGSSRQNRDADLLSEQEYEPETNREQCAYEDLQRSSP